MPLRNCRCPSNMYTAVRTSSKPHFARTAGELLRLGSRSLQVLYPIFQLKVFVLGGCKLRQAQKPAQTSRDSTIVTNSDSDGVQVFNTIVDY